MTDPFSGLVGHGLVLGVVRRALASDRLPHALLLVGPEGAGRTAVAERLLRHWLGAAALDAHPDFLRVARETDAKTGKEKSGLSVDQVRDVVERLGHSSFSGRKAVFIEEADRLTTQAANALLKTLEEPKGRVLIVLRAPAPERVPATIVSRCQVLRFHAVPRADIAAALAAQGVDGEEAARLASRAAGAPGRAFRLLRDGAARAEEDVGFAGFLSCFGAPPGAAFAAAAALVPKDDANRAAAFARTLDAWESSLRDLLLHASGRSEDALRARAEFGAVASAYPPARCTAALRALADVRRDLAHNVAPQIALERILLA